jgi:hypothetical protein
VLLLDHSVDMAPKFHTAGLQEITGHGVQKRLCLREVDVFNSPDHLVLVR